MEDKPEHGKEQGKYVSGCNVGKEYGVTDYKVYDDKGKLDLEAVIKALKSNKSK